MLFFAALRSNPCRDLLSPEHHAMRRPMTYRSHALAASPTIFETEKPSASVRSVA
jgi:hypothetical protein